MPSLHEMRPGAQPHERVGKLADGRQVLLTTRFGPVERDDGEHLQLTLVVFDADGAVLSSRYCVLGAAAQLSERAIDEAMQTTLAPLGALTASPIEIQPIPIKLLGEPKPPLVLTCEAEPGLSVSLSNDESYFVPGWPFDDA